MAPFTPIFESEASLKPVGCNFNLLWTSLYGTSEVSKNCLRLLLGLILAQDQNMRRQEETNEEAQSTYLPDWSKRVTWSWPPPGPPPWPPPWLPSLIAWKPRRVIEDTWTSKFIKFHEISLHIRRHTRSMQISIFSIKSMAFIDSNTSKTLICHLWVVMKKICQHYWNLENLK